MAVHPIEDPYRAQLYRTIFNLAAVYNLGFGIWAGFWPGAFFDLFLMEPPLYPAVWRCLGLVIGLYGLLYAYAAARLDFARPIIAVGLLGKLLGPAGWLSIVSAGEWPPRTFPLILFNDLVWWVPFALFLLEGRPAGRRLRAAAPYAFALTNAAAAAALLLFLSPGALPSAEPLARTVYISQHALAWRAGWSLWILAGLSLLGFYAWWGARLPDAKWGLAAFTLGTAGLACDLLAEGLYIGWLPLDLEAIQGFGTLLTGGVANGLYTLAGVVLTVRTRALAGGLAILTWTIWAAGLGLSLATFAGTVTGMVVASAVLFTLLSPWAVLLGRRLGGP